MPRPRDEVRRLRAELARALAERDAARLANAELRELLTTYAGILGGQRRAEALESMALAHYERGYSDCQDEADPPHHDGPAAERWGRLTIVPMREGARPPGTLKIVAHGEPAARETEWQSGPLLPGTTTIESSQPGTLSCDIDAEAG